MNEFELYFKQGFTLASEQKFHAALDLWENLLNDSAEEEQLAQLKDEIGLVYVQLGNYEDALKYFNEAISYNMNEEKRIIYHIHLAMVYRLLSDYDRAYRILTQLYDDTNSQIIQNRVLGVYFNNFSIVQHLNNNYYDSIQSVKTSFEHFDKENVHWFDAQLFNNLGVYHLELNEYDQAEYYLLKALELKNGRDLSTLSEISRLYLLKNELPTSISYANKALMLIWSSIMNFDKEEIARFCKVLAEIAHLTGEKDLAFRLVEKSQLFFGQLNAWREWEQVQLIMDGWFDNPAQPIDSQTQISIDQLGLFVSLLDALHAQEFIHPQFSAYLDTRSHYTRLLASELDVSEGDTESLIFACRFADYGLTAIEQDVIENPKRSKYSWEQYEQHPTLSVKMLQSLHIPEKCLPIIEDHHEHFDGSGYPLGKKNDEIYTLSYIFSIADYYAKGVTLENKSHSKVLDEILTLSGTVFHPEIATAFHTMFQIEENELGETA